MQPEQLNHFRQLVSLQEQLTKEGIHYWSLYSNLGTWQFWVILTMLIVPLILVYLFIDREKIFHIGFYGFATHVLFAYTDAFGIRYGLWGYPYQVLPFLPSLSLDASIIPVAALLLYQWTLRNNKKFYIYATLAAVVFGFGFKPLLVFVGLFEKYKWVNYFHIFLIYFVLFLLAYFLSKLFLWMQRARA